jgi:hypothetical protein
MHNLEYDCHPHTLINQKKKSEELMNERERAERNERIQHSDGAGNEVESLERIRQAADEFLTAGDEAIRRALSGDSEEFLRANRQRGGE